MATVQVIGLPGAGKTTGIKQYLRELDSTEIAYLDIRHMTGCDKDSQLFKAYTNNNKPHTIIESACGLSSIPSYIIQLSPPIQLVFKRLLIRDRHLDRDYLSLIGGEMVASDCTIYTAEQLVQSLETFFKFKV